MQTTHFNHVVHLLDDCHEKRGSENCQSFYTRNSSIRSQCIYVGMLAISGAPPVTHLSHIHPVLQLRDNTFSKRLIRFLKGNFLQGLTRQAIEVVLCTVQVSSQGNHYVYRLFHQHFTDPMVYIGGA